MESKEDDIYSGFGVESPRGGEEGQGGQHNQSQGSGAPGSAAALTNNPFARMAPGGGNVNNPVRGQTGARMTGRMMSGRMTGQGQGTDSARPLTSVKGAGYQSKPGTSSGRQSFDPMGQQALGPAPPLEEKSENSPEDKAREMEQRVNTLIESSAEASARGDSVLALERAKEAGKRERQLCKFRESQNLMENMNIDLTYCVIFNLANAYAANGMYQEAINSYTLIVKNKSYPTAGRLRVNMGNIYFNQKLFTKAITQYQMALDQLPNIGPEEGAYTEVRLRMMRNIGVANIKMGRYAEATQALENVMRERADFQTAFDLLLCYYARGETEQMKKCFQRLLQIPLPSDGDDDDESKLVDDDDDNDTVKMQDDPLKEEIRKRQRKAKEYILTASKLIAPALFSEDKWQQGYDWVIDLLRMDYDVIASEMMIVKALKYLKYKSFDKAIEELKAFEKKDKHLKAKAAVNLAFLYFLEGDSEQADKYANLAVRHDRYNARALVNLGNCCVDQGDLERAKELFLEAIGVEADCVEAIFNLGLVNKQLGYSSDALQAFEKLHTIVPSSPEVIYQLGNLHDLMENSEEAIKYFSYLLSKVPSDPGALARLGQIYSREEDETQAFHYHSESYRFYPTNLDVISWLGIWFVKSELYEKAIGFFERAAEVQPQEVKWRLMVASCYRRMEDYEKALEKYVEIHEQFPENVECLSYLVALCRDLNRNYQEYENKLVKLERNQAYQTQALQTQEENQQQNQIQNNYGDRYAAARDAEASFDSSRDQEQSGGMGSSTDKYAAPELGFSPQNRENHAKETGDEDDFADADIDGLLAD
eukprot:gb/GECG01015140.1/.p1 GENE.gb/GECG01015140.1/~~gb/GECG01015140.1/.p1  ORF type:complete len:821 (+),score=127.75 gb/GECG01015140.1/:1-2463(+)